MKMEEERTPKKIVRCLPPLGKRGRVRPKVACGRGTTNESDSNEGEFHGRE